MEPWGQRRDDNSIQEPASAAISSGPPPQSADLHGGWGGDSSASSPIPSGITDPSDDFGFGVGPPADLSAGTDLGGVTIVRPIGAGGMGRVYEGRQHSPNRSVAVKVMRDGIVSAAHLKRFDYEAQVLARLRHPHIAQIHALSAARIGPFTVPYIVMELVPEARAITVFCSERGVSIRQRVSLMTRVCGAVAHGHQKGVIHRDLKPGNILVDAQGDPKVIDFGVARTTAPDAAATMLTEAGQMVGTLHYMSPEQLSGRPDDIDARSDVHAIGLVLHELVTGGLPYDLRGRSAVDSARIVADHEPQAAACVARAAGTDPTISREDARSLGVIVAKCLEKRPQDRYATAAEVEAELARWLAGDPILARPLSPWEMAVRLARRHRAAAATGGISLVALVAALVGISFFAVRAERSGAAARAQLYRATVLLAASARDRGATTEAVRMLETARGLVVESGATKPIELECLAASLDDSVAVGGGHQGTVLALAWSPTGDVLASAGADGTLHIRNGSDLEDAAVVDAGASLWAMAWSPDGARVAAAAADGTARIWDSRTAQELARCTGHDGVVYGVAFSADGARLVTGGRDGTIRLWDSAGGETGRIEGHDGTVYSVAASADGAWIASGSQDATARLWHAVTGDPGPVLRGHEGRVFFVAFSPDGGMLATASEDATVRLWDVATGEPRGVLRHAVKVNAVAFIDGGHVVTATNDAVLRIWDVRKSQEVRRRLGHAGSIWTVACARERGLIASGDVDGRVRTWRADRGSNPAVPCGRNVRAIAHDSDGARIAIGTVSDVQLWDAERGRRLASWSHDGRQVNDVRFFPDGTAVAAACDRGIVEIWPLPKTVPRGTAASTPIRFAAHSRRVYSIDVDATGSRMATAGEDKTARVWRSGEEPVEIASLKHGKRVLCARFSPDGRLLYTACEDRVARVWDIADGRERTRFEGHSEPVNWLAVSPDGVTLATASSDATVRLWDVAGGRPRATLTGASQQVWKVAFTPDGSRVIAVSADGGVYLWDASSGEPVSVLRGHETGVWALSIAPAGATLATGGDDTMIRLWGIAAAGMPGV